MTESPSVAISHCYACEAEGIALILRRSFPADRSDGCKAKDIVPCSKRQHLSPLPPDRLRLLQDIAQVRERLVAIEVGGAGAEDRDVVVEDLMQSLEVSGRHCALQFFQQLLGGLLVDSCLCHLLNLAHRRRGGADLL